MIALNYSSAASIHSELQWFSIANQIICLDGDANGACGDAGDVPYSYDAYGNLTSDGMKTYAYDAENRLLSVTEGVSTTMYTYNGDGDRVSQTVDGITTTYVNDTATPLTMVLAETTGAETTYYLHGLDLVAQKKGVSNEYYAYMGWAVCASCSVLKISAIDSEGLSKDCKPTFS